MKYLLFLTSLCWASLLNAQTVDFEWAGSFGGPSYDFGHEIAVDAQGNVFLGGSFRMTADLDPGPGVANFNSAGPDDAFVIKLDGSGNFVWAKPFGASDIEGVRSLVTDGAGNVTVAGFFLNSSDLDPGPGSFPDSTTQPNRGHGFLMQLDYNGDFVWGKVLEGSNNTDIVYMHQDSSGNLYAVGGFSGTMDADPGLGNFPLASVTPGDYDAYASKLDANGNLIWVATWGGPDSDVLEAVATDPQGNVYVTGTFMDSMDLDPGPGIQMAYAPNSQPDVFTAKLDSNGNFQWARHTTGGNYDLANAVAVDHNGNATIFGQFYDDIDLDPGPGVQTAVSNGDYDLFLQQFDPNGNVNWAYTMGGSGWDAATTIVADPNGNLYFGGAFSDTVDFDAGPGTATLISASPPVNKRDWFLAMVDSNGNYQLAERIGGSGHDVAHNFVLDSVNNLYCIGHFIDSVDLDPGPGTFYQTSTTPGIRNMCVIKFQTTPLNGLEAMDKPEQLFAYPNPTGGKVKLELLEWMREGSIQIFDATGALVASHELDGSETQNITLSGPAGIYMVQILAGNKSACAKVLKL